MTATSPEKCWTLLEDIAAQSDKIALNRDGNDARKPSFAIRRAAPRSP